jgi:hypothetical protein
MNLLRWLGVFSAAVLATVLVSSGAHAAEKRGLTLSPVRSEVVLAAGGTKTGKVTIINNTPKDMQVSLGVESFSATNGSYDLKFRPAEYDWVELKDGKIDLKPGEKTVSQYTVRVSPGASAGGYYFAVVASTVVRSDMGTVTLRAAMPLYVTVNSGGKLRRDSDMADIKMPRVVTGEDFPFSFDVENKGNVHISGKFTVRVDSLWGSNYEQSEQHAVFPGSVRTIGGVLQSPLLPGLYQMTYDYKDLDTNEEKAKTTYFVSLPLWSIAAAGVLAALYIAYRLYGHYRPRK